MPVENLIFRGRIRRRARRYSGCAVAAPKASGAGRASRWGPLVDHRAHRGGSTYRPAGLRDLDGPVDGDAFVAWLENDLCPQQRNGDVVVMDNLSAHKNGGVIRTIEAAGARVLYLPPYSPDFNPIEKMWSKVKEALRAAAARGSGGCGRGSDSVRHRRRLPRLF